MKIHILVNDGSPREVTMKSIWGDGIQVGVGGAELGLLTMSEAWHNAGHEVVLFNDPREAGASPFEQRGIGAFDPNEKRDVLIVFRSPNLRIIGAKADLKVWWSTDQFTVGDFGAFRPLVDKVVTISPFHDEHFKTTYNIRDSIAIDLPVRVQDYEGKDDTKVKNRFIFTSVPARGLDIMLDIWPRIYREVPDASLTITSDYRLWGAHLGMGNEQFIAKAMKLEGIRFLSAVPRARLIEEQLRGEINLYTCVYDELFCIAVAESQVAGVYPVTSEFGALRSTNMGTIIRLDPRDSTAKKMYADEAISALEKIHSGEIDMVEFRKKAIERFHPNTILKEWNEKVFNG